MLNFLKKKRMKCLSEIAARAGIDGLLHVIVSTIIVLIMQIVAPWWVAIIVSILIGVGKELIWDLWLRKGQIQVKDLICDLAGILIGCLGML